ncbi:FAD-dependent monooxygenase [Amphibiibacter pelophylacis]|uniref:FAD-dependent monooxygenase n=1 Tax=Amphibiibacter pelophylacis TaxID=1799477 RepID=A0ACC6NZJ9_9BURK
MSETAAGSGLRLGVAGAGPVGLSLALLAAQRWARARITLLDARPAGVAPAADGRALALSWGSAQTLVSLGLTPSVLEAIGAPIAHVHVSQAPSNRLSDWASTQIHADRVGLPRLGSVVRYGDLVGQLEALWAQRVAAEPQRLQHRQGVKVQPGSALPLRHGSRTLGCRVADDEFDLLIHAEGQPQADALRPESPGQRLGWAYGQSAWVGEAVLQAPDAGHAIGPLAQPDAAFERFTPNGPLALLPLRPAPGLKLAAGQHAVSLVWCQRGLTGTGSGASAIDAMDEAARCAAVQALLPQDAPQVVAIGPLRRFDLALHLQAHLLAPRQLVAGNAAQTLHPVAGQGLNLGLRDAAALVTLLDEAQRQWPGPDSPQATGGHQAGLDHAIRAWVQQRRRDRALTVGLTHTLATGFLPGGTLLPAVRDGLLGLTQAFAPLKKALGQQLIWGLRA